MTAFDNATHFFHACESLEGWQGCQQYVADDADFSAQSEPLVDIKTVKDYCDWMAGLGNGPLKGCNYTLHTSAYDEANNTATFFATFHGQHIADGGPVAPTNKQTNSHYVYVLKMDSQGKVEQMTKIWNAPWAMAELGWG